MNNYSFDVLNIINDNCPDERFKVIDVNDILLSIDDINDIDKVFEIIDDLATEGAIELKYRDEEDICLAITLKGRRIVKKENETRAKIEAQRKVKEEEEARAKAQKEAEELARRKQEEREKQERLEKEKQLEEARQSLEDLKAQKKSKKDPTMSELKQQVEDLEKEIHVEESKDIIEEPAVESKQEITPINNIIQEIDTKTLTKKVIRVAFSGGLLGALFGNAIYYAVTHFLGM